MNNFKLGSLFDGSGGFPLSGALCGITPVWAAEVEPYPIAVTRSRFPSMKHLGDISKVNGAEIEPVDIISFGSPCQDLSVAGKRAGLKHEANGDEETTRSGLFMEAVRIIKEMRRKTNGKYPRFAIWENVPGAFSSNNGEDFRIVCEELIKIVEPSASMPSVPKGGWSYADSYVGDGWSLAYRVFDAQYWGVPQRRRRIYLVADFRGECAREVLFEREGLRGYFAQGRTPWQAAPTDAQGSTRADDREGEGFDGYNGDLTGDVSSTLGVNCGVSTGRNGVIERGRQLDAVGFDSYNLCETGDKGRTITTPSGGLNEHIPCVIEAKGVDLYNCAETGEQAATLTTQGGGAASGPSGMLAYGLDRASFNQGQNAKFDFTVSEEQQPTLTARGPGAVCVADHPTPKVDEKGVTFSLMARDYIVRRLTPTECARLQGFADNHGHLEQKDNLTEEEFRFWLEVRNTHARINGKPEKDYTEKQMLTWYNKLWTDSAEYKMWGNGIALPTALYCLQGVADALNAEEDDAWML